MKKTIMTAAFAVSVAAIILPAHASEVRPSLIQFDQPLSDARQVLKDACATLNERKFDPPEIPGTQESHIQLDCTGFAFQGSKRLAEFVYRDGELVLVWVLTDKSEEEGLEAYLRGAFGTPSHDSQLFTAFTQYQTALRKDKPEVLFYSPAVAPMFEGWFDQASAEN